VAVTRSHIQQLELGFGVRNVSNSPPPKPSCRLLNSTCQRVNLEMGEIDRHKASGVTTIPGYPVEMCPTISQCMFAIPDEVVLLYWPEDFSARNICASNGRGSASVLSHEKATGVPVSVVIDAIAFKGQDLELVSWAQTAGTPLTDKISLGPEDVRETSSSVGTSTDSNIPRFSVLSGPWTFKSPTIYVAHRPISLVSGDYNYPEDWFTATDFNISHYGTSTTILARPAGVMPLDPTDLYSLEMLHNTKIQDGIQFAQLFAKGEFDPKITTRELSLWELSSAVQFDFRQVRDPVPASLYFNARIDDCWGNQSHCRTIADDTYRPKLSIKGKFISSLMPKGVYCGMPQLVDPPIALTPIYAAEERLPSPAVAPSRHTDPVYQPSLQESDTIDGIKGRLRDDQPTYNPNQARPGGGITPPYPLPTANTAVPGLASGDVSGEKPSRSRWPSRAGSVFDTGGDQSEDIGRDQSQRSGRTGGNRLGGAGSMPNSEDSGTDSGSGIRNGPDREREIQTPWAETKTTRHNLRRGESLIQKV
jgi:hypothetical protein